MMVLKAEVKNEHLAWLKARTRLVAIVFKYRLILGLIQTEFDSSRINSEEQREETEGSLTV